MLKTIVVLPDGTELSSGKTGDCAVKSFSYTQCVNDRQELTLGSVCAAMVEITVITENASLPLEAGQEITVYRQDENDTRYPVGIFLTEKPTKQSAYSLKVTAYDRVSLLDKNLTQWLTGLEGWPYTLQNLSRMVCDACGVQLKEEPLPNGDYLVQRFYADGVTGRHLLQWIGELAGRFCRCTPDGQLEFSWYAVNPVPVGTGDSFYYQNGLSYEEYTVAPVDRVHLKQNESDVGTFYPESGEGDNTYVITGNPMMTANTAGSLIGIAQTLYEQLREVSYTPCKLTIPASFRFSAGDIVTVTDRTGNTFSAYIMTRKQAGGRDTLECTGSASRGSTLAVNNSSYKALSGKVLNLSVTVEGLKVENREVQEKSASLSLDVEGISSEVSRQHSELEIMKNQVTAVSQNSESLDIRVRNMAEQGVQKVTTETGFTFDEKGLSISKSGTRMENLLDESGMYVKRYGEVLLQANQDGVTAVDVSVGNYLVVGDHARFEDYSEAEDECRTACFFI